MKITKQQGGSLANKHGKNMESLIKNQLNESGYNRVTSKKVNISDSDRLIYTTQFKIAKSIYGHDIKCDFLLYHPQKWSNYLALECKWQQSPGSVDEKFPYLVLNLVYQYPCPSIIIVDGDGYKEGAIEWLKNQVSKHEKLLHVFNISEFLQWSHELL